MTTPLFNLEELFVAITEERERQAITWSALSRHVGVSPSTIRRFGVADDAEADGVLALVRWLGVPPEDFVAGNAVKSRRLPSGGNAYVRVDMELVALANGDGNGAGKRTRTTIQNLVAVAQGAGRSVASLTMLTDV